MEVIQHDKQVESKDLCIYAKIGFQTKMNSSRHTNWSTVGGHRVTDNTLG